MKTQAAVAVAARKPLEIITVDLDGPKAGEVLVEIKASGVCHTDEFPSGRVQYSGHLVTKEPAVSMSGRRDSGTFGCHLHAPMPALQILTSANQFARRSAHPGKD